MIAILFNCKEYRCPKVYPSNKLEIKLKGNNKTVSSKYEWNNIISTYEVEDIEVKIGNKYLLLFGSTISKYHELNIVGIEEMRE